MAIDLGEGRPVSNLLDATWNWPYVTSCLCRGVGKYVHSRHNWTLYEIIY